MIPGRRWQRRWRAQHGSAYSLSAVLTLPIFLAFVLFVFEVAILLQTHFAVLNATDAAARLAACTVLPVDDAHEEISAEAWTALAAHVGTSSREERDLPPPSGIIMERANNYAKQIGTATGDSQRAALATTQYTVAARRTTVTIHDGGPEVEVLLEYRAPLRWPVVSQLLSTTMDYRLTARVVLPREPHTPLTITYGVAP